MWRVARERALLLGGPAALLLQLAHPLVAAGVRDHSDFRADPLRRLTGTMQATLTITFGDHDQAQAAASNVRRIHDRVHGTLATAQGPWPVGTPYDAKDPQLALWVFATLVETAFGAYQLFVGPLSETDRAGYYEQSAPFAAAFGVEPPVLPESYEAFRSYYRDMLNNQLTVGDLAREQAAAVLHARLHGLPVTPTGQVLAALLLPAPVRRAYRLPTVPAMTAWPIRQSIRAMPKRYRYWPHYRQALQRLT